MGKHLKITAVIASIVLLLSGCGSVGGSTGKATSGSTLSVGDLANKIGPAMKATKTYTTQMTTEAAVSGTSPTGTIDMVVDQSDPSNLKAKASMESTGFKVDLILIGKTTYLKITGDTQWTKTTDDELGTSGLDTAEYTDPVGYYTKVFANIESITYQGAEKIGDQDTSHYTIKSKATSASPAPTAGSTEDGLPSDIWIDSKGRMVKTVTAIDSTTAKGTTTSVSKDWDQPVTITAPDPSQVKA